MSTLSNNHPTSRYVQDAVAGIRARCRAAASSLIFYLSRIYDDNRAFAAATISLAILSCVLVVLGLFLK